MRSQKGGPTGYADIKPDQGRDPQNKNSLVDFTKIENLKWGTAVLKHSILHNVNYSTNMIIQQIAYSYAI